jgi:hypothetical protein
LPCYDLYCCHAIVSSDDLAVMSLQVHSMY